jgi:hypothetical protein
MKKKMMEHFRHGWFLWIGGACFLVGSLVAGSVGLASSATTGTSTIGPTVNQGAPGTSAWPVSGTVGVDPNNNTVKLDPSHATVTSGDTTTMLYTNTLINVGAGHGFTTPLIDTSTAKTVRVYISCGTFDPNMTWSIDGQNGFASADSAFNLANGQCAHGGTTETFEVPGTQMTVTFNNIDFQNPGNTPTVTIDVLGRSN